MHESPWKQEPWQLNILTSYICNSTLFLLLCWFSSLLAILKQDCKPQNRESPFPLANSSHPTKQQRDWRRISREYAVCSSTHRKQWNCCKGLGKGQIVYIDCLHFSSTPLTEWRVWRERDFKTISCLHIVPADPILGLLAHLHCFNVYKTLNRHSHISKDMEVVKRQIKAKHVELSGLVSFQPESTVVVPWFPM